MKKSLLLMPLFMAFLCGCKESSTIQTYQPPINVETSVINEEATVKKATNVKSKSVNKTSQSNNTTKTYSQNATQSQTIPKSNSTAIQGLIIDGNGNLVATNANNTFSIIGNVQGAPGPQGPKGDKGDKGDSVSYDEIRAIVLEVLKEQSFDNDEMRKNAEDAAIAAAEAAAQAAAAQAAAAAAATGASLECADGVHTFTQAQYNFLKGFWYREGQTSPDDWKVYAHNHTYAQCIQICQIEGGL